MPYLASKFAMDNMAYDLLALFTKTTLVDKGKSPPLTVVNCKDFTQSCRPSKESNTSPLFQHMQH